MRKRHNSVHYSADNGKTILCDSSSLYPLEATDDKLKVRCPYCKEILGIPLLKAEKPVEECLIS